MCDIEMAVLISLIGADDNFLSHIVNPAVPLSAVRYFSLHYSHSLPPHSHYRLCCGSQAGDEHDMR